MPARALAAIFIGLALLSSATYGAWPAVFGTLTAVCLAYFLCGGRGRDLREFTSWLRRKFGQRRWRVMDGGKLPRRPGRFN
jgi:hypothetical protein